MNQGPQVIMAETGVISQSQSDLPKTGNPSASGPALSRDLCQVWEPQGTPEAFCSEVLPQHQALPGSKDEALLLLEEEEEVAIWLTYDPLSLLPHLGSLTLPPSLPPMKPSLCPPKCSACSASLQSHLFGDTL